jgi:two-component system, OmpR family, phosphate regulon sensor histidine kinase PhoR
VTWLFSRPLLILLALVAGSAAGYLLGDRVRAPLMSSLFGAACAVALLTLIDTLRGARLMRWLRGSQEGQAPRDTGFWGEMGYRVERTVRSLEKENAQERTRLSQFLSAIEASPNGVILLDAGDQIDWCNAVAADHFGLDPQRDIRQRITNLVRAPAFVSYLQGGRFTEAVRFAGPSGGTRLSVLVRVYGEGLKIVLSQDVTLQEQAEAMRRDFVANVSHEVRTPLTVLTGFIETMNSLPLDDAERKRMLGLMMQQAERMGTLVSDLLTLARLEGSPRPPAQQWVDLEPLMARAAAEAEALSMGRQSIQFNGSTGIELAGAEAELMSAVTNLVSNAVRYTPQGGKVEVLWRVRHDCAAELSVVDNGPGIAREHLPRLSERFYRVDGSRSRDTGGTGLGLSIVKHVVQRHGGELDIQSEVGRGSTFKLVFPAARTRKRQAREAQLAPISERSPELQRHLH